MTDHPITPPPELVKQWLTEGHHQDYCSATNHAIAQAAKWGSDQELEACVEHLKRIWSPSDTIDSLRAARRPKPPSLKEQALAALKRQSTRSIPSLVATQDCDIIFKALEQLDD